VKDHRLLKLISFGVSSLLFVSRVSTHLIWLKKILLTVFLLVDYSRYNAKFSLNAL